MALYAEGTTVAVRRSREEIEALLERYGADSFGYATEPERAAIVFKAHGRSIRFVLPLPSEKDVRLTSTGRYRDSTATARALEAETRRRWRALALAIKAKLEVVASGISSFETEFAGNIVLPDGRTVEDVLIPAIDEAYRTGTMPPTLLGLPSGE